MAYDYTYRPRRTKNLFDPKSDQPFKLSRSKIDFFIECPRCFYLDRRLGITRPSWPAFTLNSAVDQLLKAEFDIYRAKGEPHPLMQEEGITAVPFVHEHLDEWRENFVGVQALHKPTNFLVFGAVDDVWVNDKGELHVVDYKSTSKNESPTLDGFWQQAYKRQMEVYQWLLRHNGFTVSNTGYFFYVNGKKDAPAFDNVLEFDAAILPYTGDDSWIEQTLTQAHACLMDDRIPSPGEQCEYCPYREAVREVVAESVAQKDTSHEKKKKTAPKQTKAKGEDTPPTNTLF